MTELNDITTPAEGGGTPGADPAPAAPASSVNAAIEAVMDMIDGLKLFDSITRGALGTGNDLTCEAAPSSPSEVYMDKGQYIALDLTINGKHDSLETLSEDMNRIHEDLPFRTQYSSGTGWQIVDITTQNFPQVIGREDDNRWIMASSLEVRVSLTRKDV